MRVESFVIHLDRAVDRRENVSRLASSLVAATGTAVEVVSAVDGQQLDADAIAAVYRQNIHAPNYPFKLLAGEIACFLSHRRCWQLILDRNLDAAFIAEDDAALQDSFAEAWPVAKAALRQCGFVRFPNKEGRDYGSTVVRGRETDLLEPASPGLGMLGQLVSRDAAAELLAASSQFDRPVDCFVQLRSLHPVRILALAPSPLSDISVQTGTSSIQVKQQSVLRKIPREILRGLYRLQVRFINRRAKSQSLIGN